MSNASTNSGMKGTGFYDSGRSPRTQDRSRPPEPESETVKQKSATAILADFYLADFERRQAADKAEEQRKANAQHQRRLREKAEADQRRKDQELQQRRANASFIESQQDAMFDQSGLAREERALVLRRLDAADKEYDLETSKIETLRVISERTEEI
jgi:hypothetical protein